MPDASDIELLRDYERSGSEAAFAELVRRHVNLVYSAALRHVGNAAQAEEITQAVFIIFARKAGNLRANTILEGWLYETTRLTSLSFLRGERRRQFREQEAYMQSTLQEGTEDSTWNQLSPLLDEALSHLGRKDRDAVVLRFFKGRNVREMAAALEISEAAAQRRVLRAMEKLRKFFAKRGVSSTTTIIAEKISAHSIQAAPIALAKSVAVIAISKGAMTSASTLTLIKGALKIMAWTKAKTAIVVGIGVLLAAGTAEVTIKKIEAHKVVDPRTLNESFWALDIRTLIKAPQVVALRPSTNPTRAGTVSTETRMLARNVPLNSLMYYAYAPNNIYYQFHHQYRTVLAPGIADGKFDLLLTLNDHPQEALQAEIKKQLGLVAHFETRETDAILLRCSNPAAPRLTPSEGNGSTRLGRGKFDFTNQPMFALTDFLELHFGRLVIDETGLTQHYSGTLKWNPQPDKAAEQKEIQAAFLQQLGLEVVPGHESTDMLVVEKAP